MMADGPPATAPDGATAGFDADTLHEIFADFCAFPRLALAVSGGADSTALMVLMWRWLALRSQPSPEITILTVDHRLRAEAAIETRRVHEHAAGLGFAHQTLEWTEAKRKTGIQAAARKARYALMAHYCRRHAIPALATAHTRDDQAETVMMRLARAGGVDGLSGMAPRARLGGVALLRPLLPFARERLRCFLEESGIGWSEDPSNEDDRYERVRIRRMLAAQGTAGPSGEALALTAARLRRARDALDVATAAMLRASLSFDEAGWGAMPLSALAAAEDEIAIRMLGRLARAFGGGATPVPLARLEAAHEILRHAPRSLTLGGCQFALRGGELRIFREYGRLAHAEMPYRRGMLWDRRLIVEDAGEEVGVTVRPLGPKGFARIKAANGGFADTPRQAALALPSLWRGDSLVSAPFADFPQGVPRDWQGMQARFANRDMLFDPRPEIRL